MKEIPTAVTEREARCLAGLARDKNVIEIGSLFGYSTIVLARAATHVVAIDPHEGYPDLDSPPTLAKYLANLKEHEVQDKVTTILNTGDQALPLLRPDWADLIFIDISERAFDLLTCALRLRPQTIALHDCFHPQWTGATTAKEKFERLTGVHPWFVESLAVWEMTASKRERGKAATYEGASRRAPTAK